MDLAGRVAFVTEVSSGIGLAVARHIGDVCVRDGPFSGY